MHVNVPIFNNFSLVVITPYSVLLNFKFLYVSFLIPELSYKLRDEAEPFDIFI